jgi:uncharacterized membrane protein YqjE
VKADWRFLRLVAYVYVGASVVGYVLFSVYGWREAVHSVIAAEILSLLHVLLGYGAVEYSYEKSNITFLKIVLGGIGLRLFLMASVVLVLLRYYAYDPLSLTLSLLIFYVLNLVLEIYLLESKVTVKKQS